MNRESKNNNTQLRRSRRYVLWVGILGLIVFNQSGCDACLGCFDGVDLSRIPYTEILSVDLTPNPAVRGDTLFLHCVIKDSLEDGFRYRWSFETDGFADTITTTNKLTVRVNSMADTLLGNVSVFHISRIGSGVGRKILVPIIN